MDHNFIHKMCNAYYDDFELHKYHLWENKEIAVNELNGQINLLIDNVKLDDIELYKSLFEYSRDHQYTMMYYMIDQYIQDNFSDDIVSDIFSEEELNEGVISEWVASMGAGIGGFLGGISAGMMSGVIGFLTSPVAILASIAVLYKFSRQIFKGITISMVGLINATKSIEKFISNLGKSATVKNAVIYANLKTCGGKCGISTLQDMNRFTPLNIQSDMSIGEKSRQEAACLISCYFSFMLQNVTQLTKSYVECLKNSGEDIGGGLSPITLIMKEPMGSQCKVFYDMLSKHYEAFKEVNEYLHKNDKRLEQDWTNRYHKSVEDGFKNAGMSKQLFKSNDFKSKDRPNTKFKKRY